MKNLCRECHRTGVRPFMVYTALHTHHALICHPPSSPVPTWIALGRREVRFAAFQRLREVRSQNNLFLGEGLMEE